LLEFRHLTVAYAQGEPVLTDFDLSVGQGTIITLVGESGSGKTTAIRAAMGLLPIGGRIVEGDIVFDGHSLKSLSSAGWRALRGRGMSMIFQDSGAMLNPIRTIGSQFVEYIRTHQEISKKEAWELARQTLERLGLPSGQTVLKSYPFQLSGGMRQRVGIALAMVFEPRLLLADEPTSALDVTTQSQIIREMMSLRDSFGTSILLVTHNLGVAAYMSDCILVINHGRTVDYGDRHQVLNNPKSDYTRKLLEAVPSLRGKPYV
jgi:peptide/nickel transport system ATP-binding protein